MPLRAEKPQLRHGRMLIISSPSSQTPLRITIAITAQDLRKVTLLCVVVVDSWRTERWRCGLPGGASSLRSPCSRAAQCCSSSSRFQSGLRGCGSSCGDSWAPHPPRLRVPWPAGGLSMFGLAPPCRKVSPAAPPLLRLDPAKFPAIIHFDWVRCPCEFLKPGACRTTAVQRPRERFEHLS